MSENVSSKFNIEGNWKKFALPVALAAGLTTMAGCDDADVASHNISRASDNFEVNRRIIFYNGITGEYMLNIEGLCSIEADGVDNQLEVTCKTGEDEYKKHFLGLSDNVTYFAEQIEGANVSAYHYRVTFKPQTIVPDVDLRVDSQDLPRSQP